MIEEVAAGLIVAAIGAAGAWFVRAGYLARLRARIDLLSPTIEAAPQPSSPTRADELLKGIIADQSVEPPHDGQFGRYGSLAEEKAFNPTRERISAKPRMYMTRWPCLILSKNGLAPEAVAKALDGVERLFDEGIIKGQEEWSRIPGRVNELDNYRHTMCGALLLLEQRGWNKVSRGVLGAMLDSEGLWQNPDGGWAHTSPLPSESDLYSSLYATQLLYKAQQVQEVPSNMRSLVQPALERTLVYLETSWSQTGWRFEDMSSEEIAPQAFIEVAPILRAEKPNVHADIAGTLRQHVNSGGGLTRRYREAVPAKIADARLLARLAYALFRAGDPESVWRPIVDSAGRKDAQPLNSVEAAFLLDLYLKR